MFTINFETTKGSRVTTLVVSENGRLVSIPMGLERAKTLKTCLQSAIAYAEDYTPEPTKTFGIEVN